MGSLVVDNFSAGLMLTGAQWKRELEFSKSYRSVEPWLADAIQNQEFVKLGIN